MNRLVIIAVLIALSLCSCESDSKNKTELIDVTDHHVHIMSQAMVDQFKAYDIPFTHSEEYYTNIDSIVHYNPVQELYLISMAYVWANKDFYPGEDWKEKMEAENDNVLAAASIDPLRIRPFFAINPMAENALSELERCTSTAQYGGMKMHFNSSQVYLTEPEHLLEVKDVFTEFAKSGLPLLLHFDNSHPKTGSRDVGLFLNDVLIDLSPLTIILAHMGNSGGFDEKTIDIITSIEKLQDDGIGWQHKFYYDLSAVGLTEDQEYVDKLSKDDWAEFSELIKKVGTEKFVFGTDYPLHSSDEYMDILSNNLQLDSLAVDSLFKNRITSK